MADSRTKYDVVIVGMGPVGATIACLLGREGIKVRVVDREAAIFDKPRAIVLDHEVLRTLQFCRLPQSFFDSVSPHTGTDFIGQQGQLIKLFDPKAPPFEMGWPPNVMFIQPELELALAQAMASNPFITTERCFNVTAIDQDESGVRVEGTNAAGKHVYTDASYLIGADGANSIVRSAAGLEVEDLDFAEWWVVVDAWLVGEAHLPAKTTQFCQTKRPATYVVGPRNLRRWEIKLLPGEDPAIFRDPAAVNRLLADFVNVSALDIWRSAVYRFQAVVAQRWRNERLLIAGDAAHTMPPFLAQGLCAGLRDAANLSWKLAQVLRRGADPALLDTFEQERKPHVTEIVRHAKNFGLIIGELDPDKAAARDELLEGQLRDGSAPTVRQAFIPNLSGGLLDDHSEKAGSPFIQPLIASDDGAYVLMDSAVDAEFVVIARSGLLSAMPDEALSAWEGIGGKIFTLNHEPTGQVRFASISEKGSEISDWLDLAGSEAVIVRPDRYVYGTATNSTFLVDMMLDIAKNISRKKVDAYPSDGRWQCH
ncbi:bifunctional 3-(3-hydroxy-phenyl)propionate/3-hydroxycinnamic acid hydroxylase [Novosphingobium sp. MMS21-SN21R]|uniref:bifunctional 3-(3-hydroxy-phenyl)propionate/3-hydroxycinnamic acid hydroxylase n=1 Tax=Novosphingobium sp. MMS21-SN21R TaxID=2969298 RepID=UPI002883BD1B|nr:bifunctional 3-(3-hydroxy-phenyl)propionate/3-hydroxycinnamic acid hydroxylase [Novosphingobium sp. MMS21-SN21R]MDT0510268.1 bifunctional 3-(3-hydroxy-phenyl)propionate/3-hydroxycinnamic acid hydroxylase [Novosphingobium sp. MMS21-SN21R]